MERLVRRTESRRLPKKQQRWPGMSAPTESVLVKSILRASCSARLSVSRWLRTEGQVQAAVFLGQSDKASALVGDGLQDGFIEPRDDGLSVGVFEIPLQTSVLVVQWDGLPVREPMPTTWTDALVPCAFCRDPGCPSCSRRR